MLKTLITALTEKEAGQAVYFRKTSLVDYPEKVAAAIFFPFCNLRCPWCHNGELIENTYPDTLIPLFAALKEIEKRSSLIDGVVISGGEPVLFSGLGALVTTIKNMGLSVKLDTNGTKPAILHSLFDSERGLDYIAMDLKFAPRRYSLLLPWKWQEGGRENASADPHPLTAKVLESIALIRKVYEAGMVQAEFRSLVFPGGEFSKRDIDELIPLIGAVPWNFRAFRPGSCLDPDWNKLSGASDGDVQRLVAYARAARS